MAKTDRELLVQIDSKVGFLGERLEEQRADTIEIFKRLRTVEIEAEQDRGQCNAQQVATVVLEKKLDKIPNVNKAIRGWGALFAILQVLIGGLLMWKE